MKHIHDDGDTVFVTEIPPTRAKPEQELRNLCGLMAAQLNCIRAALVSAADSVHAMERDLMSQFRKTNTNTKRQDNGQY